MIEPAVALRTALRQQLIADPAVTALVQPDQVRAGSTRPGDQPCVIIRDGQTEYLGRAAGDQHLARVFLDVHVWAIEDGPETAKRIGWAVTEAILTLPWQLGEITIDEIEHPSTLWMRDPQPERSWTHGVIEIDAVIRWRA